MADDDLKPTEPPAADDLADGQFEGAFGDIDGPLEGEPETVLTRAADSDWLLAEVIKYANLGMHAGITLHVGGGVVTGVLVGGAYWIDKFAEALHAGLKTSNLAETADNLRDIFLSFKEIYSAEKPTDKWVAPPSFIHLENAKFYTPGSAMNQTKGSLWRGRLSQVSGFTLGTLSEG